MTKEFKVKMRIRCLDCGEKDNRNQDVSRVPNKNFKCYFCGGYNIKILK